jgi:hypothetical protein
MIESILERGFDRMETRFDGLAAEIMAHSTSITVLQTTCARRAEDANKRDKKISALWQRVGDFKDEVSQVTKAPSATTVPDLIKVLDEREEARSKRDRETEDARSRRMRGWIAVGVPALLAVLAVPAVRGCLGEAQTERIAASVKMLESKPAQKVIVLPPGPGVVLPKPDVEVK